MATYIDKNGKALFPLRNWKQLQKDLNSSHARIVNAQTAILCASGDIDKKAYMRLFERQKRIEDALEIFDRPFINGMVYATKEESLLINDLI